MTDILNRLHVQCGSDLHDGFVRSLFSEAAVEIERLRKDAERYRWLRKEHESDGPSYHVRRPSNCPAPRDLDADLDAAMKGANV